MNHHSHWIILLLSLLVVAGAHGDTTVRALEGQDVILPCCPDTNVNLELRHFDWKDGVREVFIYKQGRTYRNLSGQDASFKGRVLHFPEKLKEGNASILITDINVEDSGDFTCVFPYLDLKRCRVQLVVDRDPQRPEFPDRSGETRGAAPKPYTTISEVTADRAWLKCEVIRASSEPELEWQDRNGSVLPGLRPQVTKRGAHYDATLSITVNRTDGKRFRCVAKQRDIKHETSADIYVTFSGGAPKPYTTITKVTADRAWLSCEVTRASSVPQVEWLNRNGVVVTTEPPKVTETDGRYDVTLNAMVTRADGERYRCVAKQKDINREIYTDVNVPFCEETLHTGFIMFGVFVGGVVTGGCLLQAVYYGRKKVKGGRGPTKPED